MGNRQLAAGKKPRENPILIEAFAGNGSDGDATLIAQQQVNCVCVCECVFVGVPLADWAGWQSLFKSTCQAAPSTVRILNAIVSSLMYI